MSILLPIHILLFIISFALTAGIGMFLDRIAARNDAHATQAAFRAAQPMSLTGGVGWILTALSGAALAGTAGMNMTAPWLLASYAAFAVLILTGFLLHLPWQARVAKAAPGPELESVLKAPSHKLAVALSSASIVALVLLMSLQPNF